MKDTKYLTGYVGQNVYQPSFFFFLSNENSSKSPGVILHNCSFCMVSTNSAPFS